MADPAIKLDDIPWTYREYKDWELKEGERYELIDGVAYAMSSPNTEHQLISSILNAEFYNFLKEKKCTVVPAPYDVRLFYKEDESDGTVVQPDLIVVCDPEKIGPEGCRGAPDLVIEILSPSNSAIEMHRKMLLYQKAGVKEYWVINPKEKIVEIFRLENNRYAQQILEIGGSLKTGLFPGLEIKLETLFSILE